MSGHTPGPWKDDSILFSAGWRCVVRLPGDRLIDIADPRDRKTDDEDKANAALIASAPDLLVERDSLKLQLKNGSGQIDGLLFAAKEAEERQRASDLQNRELQEQLQKLSDTHDEECRIQKVLILQRDEAEKKARESNRLNDSLQKVVEAARELIGKNIGRPEVYIESEAGKYKLAMALLNLTDSVLKQSHETRPQDDPAKLKIALKLVVDDPSPENLQIARALLYGPEIDPRLMENGRCEKCSGPLWGGNHVCKKCHDAEAIGLPTIGDLLGECRECNRLCRDCGNHGPVQS